MSARLAALSCKASNPMINIASNGLNSAHSARRRLCTQMPLPPQSLQLQQHSWISLSCCMSQSLMLSLSLSQSLMLSVGATHRDRWRPCSQHGLL